MTIEGWWNRQVSRKGPYWWLCLWPLSFIYRLAWATARLVASWRPPVKVKGLAVVSVGNLSVGGTGKTPLVIALARRWGKKRKVCVLSRGYGRQASQGSLLVSRGSGPLVPARLAGDEPWLIAANTRGVAVVVDADRRRGARFARDQAGARLLLLDDGFQQRSNLARVACITSRRQPCSVRTRLRGRRGTASRACCRCRISRRYACSPTSAGTTCSSSWNRWQ
jgi:tetraacyldisaccharide-1-P 4'-kinase